MAVIDPNAAVITPPPIKYDHLVLTQIVTGMGLNGVKSAGYTACVAALNPDGQTFTEPPTPIRTQGSIGDAVATITQLAGLAQNAQANATAAANNAAANLSNQISNATVADYIAANPLGDAPTQQQIDDQTAAATAAGAAAVTAAATEIAAAAKAASDASVAKAQLAGALAQAMVAFDVAAQQVACALINYNKPQGFPTLAYQA